jgi:galactokinase
VTGARFAGQLEGAGLDALDVADKAALFDAAAAAFSALTPAGPSHAWWVPGRLEVFGTHTDYAGGRTLVAALPRGFAFLAAPRPDGEVHVRDAVANKRLVVSHAPGSPTGWGQYVDVVVRRLERNFPGARRGATIAFASDLPRAAGMSSSSALIVGIASALAKMWGLRAHHRWQQNVTSTADLATYLAGVESGRTFGQLTGDAGVGTHGGSEDHAAMLLARPREVSALSFLPFRQLGSAVVPDGWRFVIASSGIASEKTGGSRGPYNRLSHATDDLLDLWNRHNPPSPSLGAALGSREEAVQRLHHLVLRIRSAPKRDALARRLQHFCAEDAFVMNALHAFESADAASIADLSRRSQQNAETLLENQIPETMALVRAAQEEQALAARSFGAGFGGSVWALVERGRAPAFSAGWLRRYQETCPHAEEAMSFVCSPGPPLTELAGV